MCEQCNDGIQELTPEDMRRAAICLEYAAVNRVVDGNGMVEEVHGPTFGLALSGPLARDVFAGHHDNPISLMTVFLARTKDLGRLVGEIRAACEMHGVWKEVSEHADRTAAARRASWHPRLGGTGIPAEHQAPPGLSDLGSG